MIKAVGHEHLATYFAIVGRVLKPGGMFAMQVQTAPPFNLLKFTSSAFVFKTKLCVIFGTLSSLNVVLYV